MDKSIPRLFLSEVTEDYNPKIDLVLGPWCFLGREDLYPDWTKNSFIDIFENSEAKTRASHECVILAAHLVKITGDRLNVMHSRDYPDNYWWALLIRWALTIVHACWRRWSQINKCIAINRDRQIRVVVDTSHLKNLNEFKNTVSLINDGFLNSAFDFLLMSSILRILAPKNWVLEDFKGIPRYKKSNQLLGSSVDKSFKGTLKTRIGHIPFRDVPGVGPVLSLLFSLYISILPRLSQPEKSYAKQLPKPSNYFPLNFVEFIEKFSMNLLPATFGKDFKYYEGVASSNKYRKGRLFVTGFAHAVDENNFTVAHAMLNGERVVWCQHGSGYGVLDNAWSQAVNEYSTTAFLTWGWEKHGDFPGRFIKTPSPLLSKFKGKHVKKNNRVILVGTKTWVRTVRIDHAPEPNSAINYRADKILFVKSLKKEVKNNLYYKPYTRSETNFEDEGYLSKACPDVSILKESLNKSMLNCRLVVLDHPGTSLHLAMAMGVPILCYWNDRDWLLVSSAKEFFEQLREAKILFRNPIDAANHLNNIYDEGEDWFNSVNLLNIRKRWSDQFAFSKRFWWIDWLKVLPQI